MNKPPIQTIIDAWRRGRPIVPFLGAGISQSSGYPAIGNLVVYLAKVQFAIQQSVYRGRYPILRDGHGLTSSFYSRHPSAFLEDFGWPDIGQLNADLWNWIEENNDVAAKFASSAFPAAFRKLPAKITPDILAAVVLLTSVKNEEPALVFDALQKKSQSLPVVKGNWGVLLDRLTEGQADLVDELFAALDGKRDPTSAHVYMTFLTRLLGIRLILSTNFDTLLERTLVSEGILAKVFDVHRDANMPHARLVHAALSIVKLHGSAYGLRAGELLNRAADETLRQRFLSYIPDNALLVVLGFSGQERRMTGLIGAFANAAAEPDNAYRVLWLTTSNPKAAIERSIHLKQIVDDQPSGSTRISVEQIKDAGTFVTGLYHELASSYPASRRKYNAFSPRPPIEEKSETTIETLNQYPVLVFADLALIPSTQSGTTPTTNWPSWAASEFCQARGQQTIWIDLGHHGSVQSVVLETFSKLRRHDPGTPRVFGGNTSGDVGDLSVPAERIREALLRMPTTLVFDAVDAFSRSPFSHHGLSYWQQSTELAKEYVRSLSELLHFLKQITRPGIGSRSGCGIGQSSIVITMSRPKCRHIGDAGELLENVSKSLQEAIQAYRSDPETAVISQDDPRLTAATVLCNRNAASAIKANSRLDEMIDAPGGWERFFTAVCELKNWLCSSLVNTSISSDCQIAFLAFLCVFRRPRTSAMLRSAIIRWIQEPDDSSRSKPPMGTDGIAQLAYPRLEEALKTLADKNWISVFEGGDVWLARGLHEHFYERLSEPHRLRHVVWTREVHNANVPLSIVLMANWHLLIARCYYTEVFLASRDEEAFFEYIYHRISALRALALLQELLGLPQTKEVSPQSRKVVESLLDESLKVLQYRQTHVIPEDSMASALLMALGNEFSFLARFLIHTNTFAFVRFDSELQAAIQSATGNSPIDKATRVSLVSEILQTLVLRIRLIGIRTLHNAVLREHDRSGSTAAPATWLRWINQLQNQELFELSGDWLELANRGRLSPKPEVVEPKVEMRVEDAELKLEVGKFNIELTFIKCSIQRYRLDFAGAAHTAYAALKKIEDTSFRFDVQPNGQNESGKVERLPDDYGGLQELLQLQTGQLIENQAKGDNAPSRLIKSVFKRLENDKSTTVVLCRLIVDLTKSVAGLGDLSSFSWLESFLREVLPGLSKPEDEAMLRASMLRMSTELRRIRIEQRLHSIPMWSRFDSNDPKQLVIGCDALTTKMIERLTTAEEETYQLEERARLESRSRDKYAERRSQAFALRSRSLYLRGRFREAHRLLSEAESDVSEETESHQFARGVCRMFRAELMSISSEAHLLGNHNVFSALRKLETAAENLEQAEILFSQRINRPLWWLRLQTGVAQVCHDRLLLESILLHSGDRPSVTEIAARGHANERIVLRALAAIRLGLDAIPVATCSYDTRDRSSPLVRAELKLHALWCQVFVASFSCNYLLVGSCEVPHMFSGQTIIARCLTGGIASGPELQGIIDNQLKPAYELMTIAGFLKSRWIPWCDQSQFGKEGRLLPGLAGVEESMSEVLSAGAINAVHGDFSPAAAFRSILLTAESILLANKHVQSSLWEARRLHFGR